MKIAIPYENGMVFQHFGHTAEFKFYEVENGQVTASEVVSTNGQGHGALVGFLVQHNANVVFCGGIGPGAQNALLRPVTHSITKPRSDASQQTLRGHFMP